MFTLLFLLSMIISGDNPSTWIYDFEEAKTIAAKEDKQILMIFSGSDWCAPCKKLKKNILLSKEWTQFESEKVVVLYLDFPAKGKNKLSKEQTQHNEALAEKYNSSGSFPKVVLFDREGKQLREIKFEGQTPGAFTHLISEKI